MSRSIGRALLALALLVPLGAVVDVPGAGAAPAHRALVIVDTGATTYQRVVTFDADSITGLQALELAGAQPVVWNYSGQGGAVCRLFGVGRDAGPNCLGGADGDPAYWAYFRAAAGTSTFTYSRAGAGGTQVRDGDVEGWRFGTGQAPAWSPVPPVTPPTTPPPTAGTQGGGGAGASGSAPTGAVGGSGASVTGPAPSAEDLLKLAAAMEAATSTTTSTTTPAAATEVQSASARRPATRRKVAVPVLPDQGGGSPWALVGLGGLLATLVVAALAFRHRRSSAS